MAMDASRADGSAGAPPAFDVVAERLRGVAPASAPLAPGGAWEAAYTVLLFHRNPGAVGTAGMGAAPGAWNCNPIGTLRLRRDPESGGTFRMAVDSTVHLPGGQRDRAIATLECRADAAGSLVAWRRRTFFDTPVGGLPTTPAREDTGTVARGRIVRRPGRSVTVATPAVASWTLFDTVLRLREPVRCTLLDELDAVRAGQLLRRHGDATAQMASGPARLRGVLQTGEGVLPTTWWLAETGPPVLVIAGLRGWVLDPSAQAAEVGR